MHVFRPNAHCAEHPGRLDLTLSTSERGKEWLAQFKPDEQVLAARLIDEIMLVSRDDFARGMGELIDKVLAGRSSAARPIALFAERNVEMDAQKEALPYFPNTGKGRATGPGIAPIVVDPEDQEVGSEGLIANLITAYQRDREDDVVSHPGPDTLRSRKVERIVIVADFIGSGKRVWEMLEAFRRVATLRSWRSYKRVEFFVVAYSASSIGLNLVESSKLKPKVLLVTACPTLSDAFSGPELSAVTALCYKYPRRARYPIGFGWTGALIAFAHGVPNNTPAMLYVRRQRWEPLFRGRSTVGLQYDFPSLSQDVVADRASRLLQLRVAKGHLDNPRTRTWIVTLLILDALAGGARTAARVSAKTRLPLDQVETTLSYLLVVGWVTTRNALTPLGQREEARLRQRRRERPVLPKPGEPFYFPTQLRAR